MEPWDQVATTAEELTSIMHVFNLVNTHQNCMYVVWGSIQMLAQFWSVYEKLGYKGPHHYTWIKDNILAPYGMPVGPNTELALCGWKDNLNFTGSSATAYCSFPPNTTHMASITCSVPKPYFEYDGKTCSAEKPWQIMEQFCNRWVPLDGSVFIAGAGFGGDVEGAIRAGRNVYACERDHGNFKACVQRVTSLKIKLESLANPVTKAMLFPLRKKPSPKEKDVEPTETQSTTEPVDTQISKVIEQENPHCKSCGVKITSSRYQKCALCMVPVHTAVGPNQKTCFFWCDYCKTGGKYLCSKYCHTTFMTQYTHPSTMKYQVLRCGLYGDVRSSSAVETAPRYPFSIFYL